MESSEINRQFDTDRRTNPFAFDFGRNTSTLNEQGIYRLLIFPKRKTRLNYIFIINCIYQAFFECILRLDFRETSARTTYLSHKLRCHTKISGPEKSSNKTREKISYFFTCVDIADQLLTRHSPLAPLGQVDE